MTPVRSEPMVRRPWLFWPLLVLAALFMLLFCLYLLELPPYA